MCKGCTSINGERATHGPELPELVEWCLADKMHVNLRCQLAVKMNPEMLEKCGRSGHDLFIYLFVQQNKVSQNQNHNKPNLNDRTMQKDFHSWDSNFEPRMSERLWLLEWISFSVSFSLLKKYPGIQLHYNGVKITRTFDDVPTRRTWPVVWRYTEDRSVVDRSVGWSIGRLIDRLVWIESETRCRYSATRHRTIGQWSCQMLVAEEGSAGFLFCRINQAMCRTDSIPLIWNWQIMDRRFPLKYHKKNRDVHKTCHWRLFCFCVFLCLSCQTVTWASELVKNVLPNWQTQFISWHTD